MGKSPAHAAFWLIFISTLLSLWSTSTSTTHQGRSPSPFFGVGLLQRVQAQPLRPKVFLLGGSAPEGKETTNTTPGYGDGHEDGLADEDTDADDKRNTEDTRSFIEQLLPMTNIRKFTDALAENLDWTITGHDAPFVTTRQQGKQPFIDNILAPSKQADVGQQHVTAVDGEWAAVRLGDDTKQVWILKTGDNDNGDKTITEIVEVYEDGFEGEEEL